MRASEIPALREKLIEACDKRIAQGYHIASGITFGTLVDTNGVTPCCCPIGAATDERFIRDAAVKLGIPYEEANRFAAGFDGSPATSNMARLGREFYKKYVGGKE